MFPFSSADTQANLSSLNRDLTLMVSSEDFEMVVALYYEPLYRFAFSLAKTEADACDLTQQTFYIWANKGWQLREPVKVKTWLFTTLHREFLASKRRESRFPHVELNSDTNQLPSSAPPEISRFDTAHVVSALSSVEAVYRAPVTLFYLQEFSYQEISEILEIPLGTVKSRLSRGLAQLQNLLTRDFAAGGQTNL